MLDEWFHRYPDNVKHELSTRFRSSDDFNHKSAFFELYLHELLLQFGFNIEIHPYIKGQSTHPEFLVNLDRRPIFYLEATLAVGPREEVAAKKRENVVYDTLNKMTSPNFFIGIKVRGTPTTPSPGAKWKEFLEKKLSDLHPDKVASLLEDGGLKSLPSWDRNHDGWDVTFQAIPKSPEARGKREIRPLGMRMTGMTELKEHVYIRNAFKKKATRYGELNLPYIIAINVISIFCMENMIVDALFGQEAMIGFKKPNGTIGHKLGRGPNGAWFGPKGPRNTRVSAVLMFRYLAPIKIAKNTPVLWHNPRAKHPFDKNSWPLPQKIVSEQSGCIELRKGKSAKEILSLPDDWPILGSYDED